MTDAERRLWALLRRKKLDGFRFRRQAQIGPYYADFFCPKAKLIVEVDGAFHGDADHAPLDETRTYHLKRRGCGVIRFWNTDVFMYPDRVVDIVYGALTEAMSKKTAVPESPLPSRLRRATFPHKGGRGTR
jgi:adenine-specific DNA-methyltransferase